MTTALRQLRVALCPFVLVLASCGASISTDNTDRHEGAGVVLITQLEASKFHGEDSLATYSSKTAEVNIDGGKLTVNRKSYGQVQRGDEIDVREPGVVKVNGVVRTPSGA